jgi:hypothetical protein
MNDRKNLSRTVCCRTWTLVALLQPLRIGFLNRAVAYRSKHFSTQEYEMRSVLMKTCSALVVAMSMAACATVEDVQRAQATADDAIMRADRANAAAQTAQQTAQQAQQAAAQAQQTAQGATAAANAAGQRATQAEAAARAATERMQQTVLARGERG